MNKTFYFSEADGQVLDELHKVLDGQPFSTWVVLQAKDFIAKKKPQEEEKPQNLLGKCQYPRIRKQNLDCSAEVCPVLLTKCQGYSWQAQKKEFEAKEKCIFRLKEVENNAV